MTFFFFNDTATTEIYTLSLHDALPISNGVTLLGITPHAHLLCREVKVDVTFPTGETKPLIWIKDWDWDWQDQDRKSTRLNSSHANISYAVFCLKKKKQPALRRHTSTCH